MDESKNFVQKKRNFPENLIDELGSFYEHERIEKANKDYAKLLNLAKNWPIIFNNGLSVEVSKDKDVILILRNNKKIASIPHGSIVKPAVIKTFSSPHGSKEWGFVLTIYFNETEERFCFCKEKIQKKVNSPKKF